MHASLREFLSALDDGGQLLKVSKEVDPTFELNAVIRKIQSASNLPVLFERVRGTKYRVVSNTLGNMSIIAGLLGVKTENLAATWTGITETDAANTEEHLTEDADYDTISLQDLPHIIFSEKDAGPYLTASVIVARDPDSGTTNLSYHRMQIVGESELRCRLSPSGDLFRIHQKMELEDKPLKAVVAIGLPPAIMLSAAATIGPFRSEYDLAARISGKRFVTRNSPLHGLPVPRTTEFLIEGEILPNVRKPEGPFGEWQDYYSPVTDNHVFEVQRVSARQNAVFYAISAGSTEEIAMTAVPIAGMVLNSVRTWLPNVVDVTCFPLVQFCAIKIKNSSEGQARRAILAAFGAELNRLLYCVVVDDDVNIHSWNDVLWAMATRCRPDRDIFQIPEVPSFARDPHRIHWGRLGVDATKPIGYPADFERKRVPGLEQLNLDEYVDNISRRTGRL